MNIELYKNITRYINYYGSILVNPVFDYKNIHLKSIIINGAPAIFNDSDDADKKFIIINEKSYYRPVLRIISNNKVVYCSFTKYTNLIFRDKIVSPVFYSSENCVKFDINSLVNTIFNSV